MPRFSVRVDASIEVPVGIEVAHVGPQMHIASQGFAAVHSTWCGPSGFYEMYRDDAIDPSKRIGALLVKCSSGEYVYVGGGLRFDCSVLEHVTFVYNDRRGTYRDNKGGFDVTVEIPELDSVKSDGFTVFPHVETPVNTHLTFSSNDEITIFASGFASVDDDWRDSSGFYATYRQNATAPTEPIGALLVKCGPFYQSIGGGLIGWRPPTSDPIELVYNDKKGSYRDNRGQFNVTIMWRSVRLSANK